MQRQGVFITDTYVDMSMPTRRIRCTRRGVKHRRVETKISRCAPVSKRHDTTPGMQERPRLRWVSWYMIPRGYLLARCVPNRNQARNGRAIGKSGLKAWSRKACVAGRDECNMAIHIFIPGHFRRRNGGKCTLVEESTECSHLGHHELERDTR